MDLPQLLIGLCIGVAVASACGFRVFVPLFVMGLGGASGYLTVASNMQWMTSTPALAALGTATALEILGYYVPWVDHLLDTVATPAAMIAGTVASAAAITGADPMIQWALSAIVGGGAAGTVQALTITTRAASTATTAGLGNPAVSTAEAGLSLSLSALAVFVPLLAGVVAIALIVWVIRKAIGLGSALRRRRAAPDPARDVDADPPPPPNAPL